MINGDKMAWMRVKEEVNYRRKGSVFSFNAKPSPIPQQFPRDFVDYAVDMGRAEEVPPLRKEDAAVVKRRHLRKETQDGKSTNRELP